MAVHKWSDITKRSKLSPKRIAEIESEAEQEVIGKSSPRPVLT